MGKQSGFLARIQAEKERSNRETMCFVRQNMCDVAMMALNEEFGFGPERLIERYTNPGERVGDPFGGIGTVPLRALMAGRKGWMSELNGEYWQDAVNYLKAEEEREEIPTLFDLVM